MFTPEHVEYVRTAVGIGEADTICPEQIKDIVRMGFVQGHFPGGLDVVPVGPHVMLRLFVRSDLHITSRLVHAGHVIPAGNNVGHEGVRQVLVWAKESLDRMHQGLKDYANK